MWWEGVKDLFRIFFFFFGQSVTENLPEVPTEEPLPEVPSEEPGMIELCCTMVHFTVVCMVAKPLNRNEAKGYLVMIQILLLFK